MSWIEYVTMSGGVLIATGMLWHGWSLLIALKESIKSGMKVVRKSTPGVGSEKNLSALPGAAMHYGENIAELQGFPTTGVTEEEWVSAETDKDGYVLPTEEPANPHHHTMNQVRTSPCYRPELEEKQPANDPGIEALEIISAMLKGLDKRLTHVEEETEAAHQKLFVVELEASNRLAELEKQIKRSEEKIQVAAGQRFQMAGNAEKRLTALEENTKIDVDNMSNVLNLLEKMTTNMLGRDKRIAEVEDRLRDAIFILYGGKKPDVE